MVFDACVQDIRRIPESSYFVPFVVASSIISMLFLRAHGLTEKRDDYDVVAFFFAFGREVFRASPELVPEHVATQLHPFVQVVLDKQCGKDVSGGAQAIVDAVFSQYVRFCPPSGTLPERPGDGHREDCHCHDDGGSCCDEPHPPKAMDEQVQRLRTAFGDESNSDGASLRTVVAEYEAFLNDFLTLLEDVVGEAHHAPVALAPFVASASFVESAEKLPLVPRRLQLTNPPRSIRDMVIQHLQTPCPACAEPLQAKQIMCLVCGAVVHPRCLPRHVMVDCCPSPNCQVLGVNSENGELFFSSGSFEESRTVYKTQFGIPFSIKKIDEDGVLDERVFNEFFHDFLFANFFAN